MNKHVTLPSPLLDGCTGRLKVWLLSLSPSVSLPLFLYRYLRLLRHLKIFIDCRTFRLSLHISRSLLTSPHSPARPPTTRLSPRASCIALCIFFWATPLLVSCHLSVPLCYRLGAALLSYPSYILTYSRRSPRLLYRDTLLSLVAYVAPDSLPSWPYLQFLSAPGSVPSRGYTCKSSDRFDESR